MATHPDFRPIQTDLAALGLYNKPIDDDWGDGMAGAIRKLISEEKARRSTGGLGPVSSPPAATAPPIAAPGGPRYPNIPWGKVPRAYHWLRELALPLMVEKALELYGTVEVAGQANSPIIMGWADQVGVDRIGYRYTADSVAWCGLFMAAVAVRANKQVPTGPLWALNWGAFGVKVLQPGLGDVLTFVREGGGHVALYIGEDKTHYYVLGGNQSDAVSIMKIAKSRMKAARRPTYNAMPVSVKPYILTGTGTPVSTNER